MKKQFFITGIGTEVGKTVVSAILSEAMRASYWKPIQAGELDNSDAITVERLTSNVTILPEEYRLQTPMSPHAAAKIDGVKIDKIPNLPSVENNLIVEGAGGLLVPLNDAGTTTADWMAHWNLPTIIVSKNYLGSINHTLLTLENLKSRNIPIHGVVFVGEKNQETENIICSISKVKHLGRVPWTTNLNQEFIAKQAEGFNAII